MNARGDQYGMILNDYNFHAKSHENGEVELVISSGVLWYSYGMFSSLFV